MYKINFNVLYYNTLKFQLKVIFNVLNKIAKSWCVRVCPRKKNEVHVFHVSVQFLIGEQ